MLSRKRQKNPYTASWIEGAPLEPPQRRPPLPRRRGAWHVPRIPECPGV
jgi:hypothetical protein